VISLKPLTQIRRSFEEFRFQGMKLISRQSAKPAKIKNQVITGTAGALARCVAQD
jgi:hypothetical protein